MALESVADHSDAWLTQRQKAREANNRWRPSNKDERPVDTGFRKLYQAEMLAHTLYGDGFESFNNSHDRIQEGVLWLLADLITEAREANEAAERAGEQSA